MKLLLRLLLSPVQTGRSVVAAVQILGVLFIVYLVVHFWLPILITAVVLVAGRLVVRGRHL